MKYLLIGLLAIFPLLLPLVESSALSLRPISLPYKKHFNERECLMCKFSVNMLNYAIRTNKGSGIIDRVARNFCSLANIESDLICSKATKLYNNEIIKVLTNGFVIPDQICGYLSNNTCGTFHNPLGDWEVNLNISVTLDHEELAKMRQIQQALREPMKPYRVIHISDTHIDLQYSEGSPVACLEPLCCRDNSTPNNETQINSGHWGSYGKCDVPIRTLESLLSSLNSTLSSENDIEYIIWTGDIQPHDIWEQNKTIAAQTYDAVFSKIFEYLPNAKIFPTLGNHEMIPVDSFSPSNMLNIAQDDSPEWLYNKLDSFWSRWLPPKTSATITRDGFYATTVRPGLKVISLNTNFCHNKNFWLYINTTDPGNQLEWLINELQLSELEHEQVHIIGHIPPGVDDCFKVWSKNYNRIIDRFSKTVSAQFFGHTHNGEFEIFYDQSVSIEPTSVGFIGPSVTSFIDLNPGFRIYSIDPNESFAVKDFETFYMNLTAANENSAKNSSIQPSWTSIGLFTKTFNIKDTSPGSLHNLLIDLAKEIEHSNETEPSTQQSMEFVPQTTHTFDSKLYSLYRQFNTYSDKFQTAQFEKMTDEEKKTFLCRFFTSKARDLSVCKLYVPYPNN